jgi:hypothetical protein
MVDFLGIGFNETRIKGQRVNQKSIFATLICRAVGRYESLHDLGVGFEKTKMKLKNFISGL